ncbi:transporter associated domain-containing protein [Facilibium subflavum]|uniref:transporter associated domain-containing protein n=1 Tax=Facilibium subflavum TaxID=2219058 RepID=UPI000E64680F|nr:transporter associated domain-containing protein [Facilibium subflavum]
MDDKNTKNTTDEVTQSWLEKIAANILMPHSPAEFLTLVNLAVKKGTIDAESRDMIKGVLNVASSQVRDIMIPRTQMATIHIGMSGDAILEAVTNASHTRFPVFAKNREDIVGILHTKDLLKIEVENNRLTSELIRSILRPAIFVPESKKLDALLREFKSSHNHLAIVVDEYGVISGLITIEDILEEIVGDIEDEFDEEETQIRPIDDEQYSVDALTEIGDFNDFFDSDIDDDEVDTIGGLVVNTLEHLPKVGEEITIDKFLFRVSAADERRVLTLTVKPLYDNAS